MSGIVAQDFLLKAPKTVGSQQKNDGEMEMEKSRRSEENPSKTRGSRATPYSVKCKEHVLIFTNVKLVRTVIPADCEPFL